MEHDCKGKLLQKAHTSKGYTFEMQNAKCKVQDVK